MQDIRSKQLCARSKSIPDFTITQRKTARKWGRWMNSSSGNNECRIAPDHSNRNLSKSILRSHPWLALQRLRWRLQKYLPKAAFNNGEVMPDPDRILQNHIERIPHLWNSYYEAPPNVTEHTGQTDDYGFVLLTEDDCTEDRNLPESAT
ncbi:conserved hypothetical protein [Echinococcus multilocularis]|uniref:Uncharacterized protein n=1 Tax=Echinococcus multilocularis TaxID=6211 RepID=A0A068Y2Q1_ECHMU|nr:conserved hypothetical protein [Echinococcus multilocularis]